MLLPLTTERIRENLRGKATYGTFVQRPNSTVRMMVFDVDVSKKMMLRTKRNSDEFLPLMQKALDVVSEIKKLLSRFGIQGYVEYSGYRGYHVWVILAEWIPTRYAVMFMEIIMDNLQTTEEITVECFPNNKRIRKGKNGQKIKLPYGIHVLSGERSVFLGDDGEPVYHVDMMMDTMAKTTLSQIKQVIAKHSKAEEANVPKIEVDKDITPFGNIDAAVKKVLESCNLMRYLCQKARNTGYLSHFERQSVLYVFGHMGEEGKQFVHQVMKYTLNYKYNVTQRFIDKMPQKPISCLKLREQYKRQSAEFGCSCSFTRSKGCYPSPVLHAIAMSEFVESDITIPTSRSLTKAKEEKVLKEMNVHAKVTEVAKKLQELNKQKRNINRAIAKTQTELERIYDDLGVDSLEIEMGLLTRRKIEKGYEWLIEI